MTTKKSETTQAQHERDHAQQGADAPIGQQAWGSAFESAQSMWRQLVDTQVQAFEAAITQADRVAQRQMTRLQEGLDESTRLTRSALTWMIEVQAEVGKAAVEAVRSAAARAQHKAA